MIGLVYLSMKYCLLCCNYNCLIIFHTYIIIRCQQSFRQEETWDIIPTTDCTGSRYQYWYQYCMISNIIHRWWWMMIIVRCGDSRVKINVRHSLSRTCTLPYSAVHWCIVCDIIMYDEYVPVLLFVSHPNIPTITGCEPRTHFWRMNWVWLFMSPLFRHQKFTGEPRNIMMIDAVCMVWYHTILYDMYVPYCTSAIVIIINSLLLFVWYQVSNCVQQQTDNNSYVATVQQKQRRGVAINNQHLSNNNQSIVTTSTTPIPQYPNTSIPHSSQLTAHNTHSNMIRAILLTMLLAVSTMAFAPVPAFRTGKLCRLCISMVP